MLRWGLWVIYAFTAVLGRPAFAQTNPSVAFFYGKPVPVGQLGRFDWVVVEPDHLDARGLDELQRAGVQVFAPGRRALRLVLRGRLRGPDRDGERRRALVRRARRARGPADPRVAARGASSPGSSATRGGAGFTSSRPVPATRPSASMRWRGHPDAVAHAALALRGTPRAGARPSRPRSGASRPTTRKPACSTHIDGSTRRHTHGRRRSSAQL